MPRRLFAIYSRRARERRARIFLEALRPTAEDRILDLGSEDGSHIASILPWRENIVLADISAEALERGRSRHGFHRTVLLDESGILPFEDASFDIVFCSSVIEHVTVDKGELHRFRSSREFEREARRRQRRLADEIRRVGRRYFVQTPNRYFLIESHTWLPGLIVLLPRPALVRVVSFFNRWWPKKTSADWHLLTAAELHGLFPEADIVRERSLGLTKSIMAIRRAPAGSAARVH